MQCLYCPCPVICNPFIVLLVSYAVSYARIRIKIFKNVWIRRKKIFVLKIIFPGEWISLLLEHITVYCTKTLMIHACVYHHLRDRRALSQFNDILLRTRRALMLYKVCGNSAHLVLKGTSLNGDNALLALKWWEVLCTCIAGDRKTSWPIQQQLALQNAFWVRDWPDKQTIQNRIPPTPSGLMCRYVWHVEYVPCLHHLGPIEPFANAVVRIHVYTQHDTCIDLSTTHNGIQSNLSCSATSYPDISRYSAYCYSHNFTSRDYMARTPSESDHTVNWIHTLLQLWPNLFNGNGECAYMH